MRLGWLVVPPALRDDVVAVRARSDRFTTSIIQATVTEFIQCGDLDRHLRRTRRSYRQRRDALIVALRQQLPEYRATGVSAGLHVLVRLPVGVDTTHLAATAARHGILIHTLDRYRSSPAPGHHPAIVICYSRLTPHHVEDGIHHLAILNTDDVTTRPAENHK